MQVLERTQQSRNSDESSTKALMLRLLPFVLVFSAACLMFFADLGRHPLFNPDEALYAEPAREMLESGEYVTTYLNYVVRFTKPPLVIWAMAFCYQIFGVNEFAARFFGGACGAILVAVTYVFTERYVSRRAAVLAGLALTTAPLFIGTAREAITDMPLSLFIAGALMAFFHGFTSQVGFWKWVGYGLLGLAVMTKGPVGLILPAAVLGIYHLVRRDVIAALRYYNPIGGLLVVAAIAAPWFALEIYVTKGAYYQEFLVRENLQRFTSVVDHQYPWWYHLAAVGGGFMPWTVFVPQSIYSSIKRGFGKFDGVYLFAAIWFLVILAFFSVSVSKLIPYTMPAFPALAIMTGAYLDRCVQKGARKELALPIGLLSVALAVALYVVPLALPKMRDMPSLLPGAVQSAIIGLLVVTLIGLLFVMRKKLSAGLYTFAGALVAAIAIFGGQILGIVSDDWEAAIQRFSEFAALSDREIVVYVRKPSVPFYAKRKVVVPGDELQLKETLSNGKPHYIIAKTKELATFEAIPGCKVLVKDGRFTLLSQTTNSH